MKNRIFTTVLIALLSFTSISLWAQGTREEIDLTPNVLPPMSGVALYDWLGTEGYYTEIYTDDKLQDLVAEGLEDENPDVVSATIGSLAWYAVHLITQLDNSGKPRFDRGLNTVPNLKQTLIEVWRANKNEDSYPLTEEDVENSMEVRNDLVVLAHDFVWSNVPSILAALYPQDEEVHEIIWDAYDPENPANILDWLNRGKFKTERATKLRVEALKIRDGLAPLYAAVGLGLTKTNESLQALVDRLEEDPGSRALCAHLVEAIAFHDEHAIPHLDLLHSSAEKAGLLLPEGITLERPDGYGVDTDIGIEYRIQQAFLHLDELQEKSSDED